MGFIPRNDAFICQQCGTSVSPARGTFRNHCPACLASKHVDGPIPGDRISLCGGLMPAMAVEGSNPDTLVIIHTCTKCGHTRRNRRAPDDGLDALLTLAARSLPLPQPSK